MSEKTPADAPATASKPIRVWPKLLLWSLVLAFGFLYLRSLDYPATDYPQAEAPKPSAPLQQAAPPAAAQVHPAAPPKPAAPAVPAMPQPETSEQAASALPAPSRLAPVQPEPVAARPDVEQGAGAIKTAESEAFAQRVMPDPEAAQRQNQNQPSSQGATQAQPGAGVAPAMVQPRYPQRPAYGYAPPPVQPAQPRSAQPPAAAAYQNQYADYLRQQREAYEAARKRWEEAYGQYPQVPGRGGYPGYYPPGYYQGGR